MAETTRPDFVTDEHLDYLDELRASGETNMMGAARYLEAEFPDEFAGESHSFRASKKATAALSYWMATFPRERAKAQP